MLNQDIINTIFNYHKAIIFRLVMPSIVVYLDITFQRTQLLRILSLPYNANATSGEKQVKKETRE